MALFCLFPFIWPLEVVAQRRSVPTVAFSPVAWLHQQQSSRFVRQRGIGRGNENPAAALTRARAQHAAIARAATSATVSAWQPLGPSQVTTSTFGLVTGRITSIAADPSDATGNTVYFGSTGGGVWKSTNAAADASTVSFTPLTDNLSAYSSAALASLSIGAVSVQPGGTGVILAGTGDPNDATDSWYGAGLLRSTDSGNTWTLISSTATSPSGLVYNFTGNAFAGFAWSGTNPNLVIAAVTTSEYADTLGLTNNLGILGLYYSQDAGATWQLATIEDGSTVIQSSQINLTIGNAATAVVWNPIRQRFYTSIRYHGYYESTDGITWTRLANQPGVNLTTALCPANPGSTGSTACPLFRGALAVQPVTGDMFALTVDQNNLDQGIWQDLCSASSGSGCASSTVQWGTKISDTALDSASGDGTISDGTYNLWLAAVPSQQDTVLFAGTTDIWRCSLANSCSWRNTTNSQTCASAKVAVGQHAVDSTFGSNGLLYFGNDGGLWRTQDAVNQQAQPCSADDATHFQNLNSGIGSLAEVESIAEDPGNQSTLLAALGALGTAAPAATGSVWNQVFNGEGNYVAIDPANTQNWYATSEFGVGINACSQGTSCNIAGFGSVAVGESQVSNDVQTIPAPWLLDAQDSSSVILGTCRVWRGPVSGTGWSTANLLSNSLDGESTSSCNGNAEIRSLAAGVNTTGAATAEQIYAGIAGTLDGGGLVPGHVFTASINSASSAATTTWTDIALSPVTNTGASTTQFNPGGFDVSSLYVDPHDPSAQTVYATVQGYAAPTSIEPVLYRSTDAGSHWTDISSNLPAAPANSVVVDPNDPLIVYVALDTGVYYTENITTCGQPDVQCWNIRGTGLPNAPVTALETFSSGGSALLRAATYGRGIWQINLVTAGLAQTTASISPASLSFPSQAVQTASAPQVVTITNTGSVDLSVSALSMAGDFSETDNCTAQPIAPQATCQINVIFDPSQTGTRTGSAVLYANIASGEATVALDGTGLAPASVTLIPSTLTFPATTTGSTSAAQIVTVNNNGGEATTLQSETVSGDFAISANTCASSLAAQSSCSISIVFKPTASGTRTGTLSVTDGVGAQTATLSGTGESVATGTLSASSVSFGSQIIGTTSAAQQITVTNSGDESLSEIAVTASAGFSVASNCGATLQGHSSCALQISFTPTTTGAVSGTLTFVDEYRTQTVALSGTGIAPAGLFASPTTLSFGSIAVGSTSAVQTVTVTNNGGSAVQGLSATVTGGFAIASNNCSSALDAGSTCQIGITFTAASAGTVSGTLTLSATNVTPAIKVPLSASGEDFTIGVTGLSSAVVTSGQTAAFALQLAGVAGSAGTVVLACSGEPKNATCSVNPTSLAFSGANTSSATVSVATGVQTTAALGWKLTAPLLAMLAPGLWIGLRRRRYASLGLLLLVLFIFIPGCSVTASGGSVGSGSGNGGGGSGGNQYSTPSGTYTLTVTATMGNIQHSTTVNLTVQ